MAPAAALLAACSLFLGGVAFRQCPRSGLDDLQRDDLQGDDLQDLVRVAISHSAPPGNFDFNLTRAQLPKRKNVSAATQGHVFKMKKVREYSGTLPKWEVVCAAAPCSPPPASRCSSTKWAVVTSIFDATESIKQMARMPDWCTVVVGDLKGPQRGEYMQAASVVHLSAADQRDLAKQWRTAAHLPWNSFGRKNLGYLYAAAQGAETILDIDDDNMPLEGADSVADMWGNPFLQARLVSGPAYANVYPLFASNGSGNLWPRGYPLQGIQEEAQRAEVSQPRSVPTDGVGVVQSLAQGNPDVDAIYRLTGRLPVVFEEQPPVVLQPGTMSPFNAQATFWRRPAFLAMLLPVKVHGRVADIWRSLIAQPVLWNGNMSLAFVSPKVEVETRNEHVLMADFEAEWPLYYEGHALQEYLALQYIASQRPGLGKALPDVLFNTYVQLYEHGILEMGDVALAEAWIGDMVNLGLVTNAPPGQEVKARPERAGFVLHLHANWAEAYESIIWLLNNTPICHPRNFMLCVAVSDWSRVEKAQAALSTVRMSKYGVPVKPVDCAANADARSPRHGALMHACFSSSLQLARDSHAEGVLFLADDTMLLTPWLAMMPYLATSGTAVMPFGGTPGRSDLKKSLGMEDFWLNPPERAANFTRACESLSSVQKERLGFTPTSMPVLKAMGDALYVPSRQFGDFQELAGLFFDYGVMEEWALPTITRLLSGDAWAGQWPMTGRAMYGDPQRKDVMIVIDREIALGEVSFLHPVKLSNAESRAKVQEVYERVFGDLQK